MLSPRRAVTRSFPGRMDETSGLYVLRAGRSLSDGPAASEEFACRPFFVSFVLIFFAELGDKSQLVALWIATRYRWWLVVAGVSVATLVVHLGSTVLGESLGSLLPEWLLLIAVGLSFFVFAAWGLKGDKIG